MRGISGILKRRERKMRNFPIFCKDMNTNEGCDYHHGESSKSSQRTAIRLKDSAVDEKLTKRFEMPFELECKGCNSVIAKGVKVNAIKKSVGNYNTREIWNYIIECSYCGCKIILERISHDSRYKVIKGGARRKKFTHEGAGADSEPWKQKCSCKISDRIPPGSCVDPTVFDRGFHVALVRVEPRFEGDPDPILRSVF